MSGCSTPQTAAALSSLILRLCTPCLPLKACATAAVHRKAAALLGLQPRLDKADDAVNQLCTTAHPSAAALLAWRYAAALHV